VVGGVDGRAEVFDNFLAAWEIFSPAGGIDAETERRRVAAVVIGEEFDKLVWRVRGVLMAEFSSLSTIEVEPCQVPRGKSGVGGIALLDFSEPRESTF
jgi:hypothetical protein